MLIKPVSQKTFKQHALMQLSLISLLAALTGCGGGGSNSTPVSATVANQPGDSNGVPSTIDQPRGNNNLKAIAATDYFAGRCAADPSKQYSLGDEMSWITAFVNKYYLWYKDVPLVSQALYQINSTVPYVNPSNNTVSNKTLITNYDVVDAYFNMQRSPGLTGSGKPKDQFHFTRITSNWLNLSQQGIQASFGFELSVTGRNVVISYVTPGTPADNAKLHRGEQIISVNNVLINDNSDAGIAALNAGLFNPPTDTSTIFVLSDPTTNNAQTSVTMTAEPLTITPVQNVTTLGKNNDIGYFLYTDQIATAEPLLIDAINRLNEANIHELILDLRYNGGGYLALASELAYMIAGPDQTSGKIFSQDSFNDKNPFALSPDETKIPFYSFALFNSAWRSSGVQGLPPVLPSLNLKRVFVITGAGTCSASEALMNGLVGIGVEVIQIGATTCGKPYGFTPQDNCGTTYFTIEFEGVNNQGFGAYADGFVPAGITADSPEIDNNLHGCVVADDFNHPLGSPSEARLAAALSYLNDGSCPVSPTVVKALNHYAQPVLVEPAPLMGSPTRENSILMAPRW